MFIDSKVLTVDPERNRVVLTAKKTLLDTTLPILTSFSDAKVGLLTHAVIFRVTDKHLMVEFFNNVKAVVPAPEARYNISQPLESTLIGVSPVKRVQTLPMYMYLAK